MEGCDLREKIAVRVQACDLFSQPILGAVEENRSLDQAHSLIRFQRVHLVSTTEINPIHAPIQNSLRVLHLRPSLRLASTLPVVASMHFAYPFLWSHFPRRVATKMESNSIGIHDSLRRGVDIQ